jgi:hypothetical protein
MKKVLNISLLLLIIGVFACTPPATPGKNETLSRSWKIKEVSIDGTVDNTTNYSAYVFKFNLNGTYEFTKASVTTGNWELNDNGSILLLDKGTSNEEAVSVITITGKTLVLEFAIPATYKEPSRKIKYTLE